MPAPESISTSESPSYYCWAVVNRQLIASAAASLVLGLVLLVLYLHDRRSELGLRRNQGKHRIDVARGFLSREIASVQSDLLYLADQELLRRFFSCGRAVRPEVEQEYLRFAASKKVYDQVRCLDNDGKELIRVNYRNGNPAVVPTERLQLKDDRYYYRQAISLSPGEVFLSHFDLNVEHGQIERPLKPVLRFATPVFDAAHARVGLSVLNYLGGRLLAELDSVSLPGSTLLVNAQGEYLRGLNPDDAWGWLLGHPRNFPATFPDAWKQIHTALEGQVLTREGLFTHQRICLSGSQPTTGSAGSQQTAPGRTGPDRSAVILVSYLPRQEVYADSARLLTQLLLMGAGAIALVFILSGYWAHASVVRQKQALQIAQSEQRLRKLSAQLLTAQETERRTISRELHDEIGQQVTAVYLDIKSAARHLGSQASTASLSKAIEETEHLLRSLHDIATRVRPSVLDDLGLRDALESLLSDFMQRTGITVNADLDDTVELVPTHIGENIYRILQEALTNTAKHALTDDAAITISVDGDALNMILIDQGVGFNVAEVDGSRLGILGMRERTELLGGRFTLTSAPGEGTRIEVSLPFHAEN